MAALPKQSDPTLDAVNQAICVRDNAQPHRPYLGMSSIGKDCSRALWYDFRWCTPNQFDALSLRRFEDGHRTEDLEAERLRLVKGLELYTIDRTTGRQIACADHGGHFRGHLDGIIHRLLQAPKTLHVWEHKAANDKKYHRLEKLKHDKGEKNALKAWDAVYYAQAVLYMDYQNLTRHYLTCSTPGGRTTISCRTDVDSVESERLKNKALAIIKAQEPPAKLNDDPAWYECKWCNHYELCHFSAGPALSCRTCVHATPELEGNGRWSCAKWNSDVPERFQRVACQHHLVIPQLLINWAELMDAGEDYVEYKNKLNDVVFRNGPHEGQYKSAEFFACHDKRFIGEKTAEEIKSVFPGAQFACDQDAA